MSEPLKFDYYYGIEAEQFTFYRVPRLLIKDERFRGLSSDAKLLYGLMLDRMSLSMKNEWLDEKNRAYIIYTIDNMMEDLGCARATCVKVIKELDSDNGIGLIEKKRRGLGKPDIIYVKNFAAVMDKKPDETAANADKTTEVQNLNFKKSNNYTSGSSET
ncbi:MAG: replication initiator protein A, partial [Lachnospiraceae bacterium]|nr:replication initiator protein A [Lachnospiraceae bacterium]